MKWISVEERLPDKLEKIYLLLLSGEDINIPVVGYMDDDKIWHPACFTCQAAYNNKLITHWMDIPDFSNEMVQRKEIQAVC